MNFTEIKKVGVYCGLKRYEKLSDDDNIFFFNKQAFDKC